MNSVENLFEDDFDQLMIQMKYSSIAIDAIKKLSEGGYVDKLDGIAYLGSDGRAGDLEHVLHSLTDIQRYALEMYKEKAVADFEYTIGIN